MNFRDQPVTCGGCGKIFVFTVTEQRNLHESGAAVRDSQTGTIIPPPKCPTCSLQDPETGRWTGRVKWFSHEKGYGFIVKPDDKEVFFHRSQVVDEPLSELSDGIPVSFEQVSTDRGDEARQVRFKSE